MGRLQSVALWVTAALALAAAVHAAVALSGGAQAVATAAGSGAVTQVGIFARAGQYLLRTAMNVLPSGDHYPLDPNLISLSVVVKYRTL